jgi:two-component system, chemotaxis family, sensor kinase CheA
MDEIEKFRQLFIKEATGLIDSLEGILLDLESNPENAARIGEVFRVMHTLKGVGSMYGYTGISDLTHGLENIFDKVRNGQCAVTPEIIELTFSSIDHLFALLEDAQVTKPENIAKQVFFQDRISSIVGKCANAVKKPIQPISKKSTKSTFNIIFQPTDEIFDRRISILYSFKDLAEIGEIKAVKSLPSEDNRDRWSLFVVGQCTRNEVEEALMFIWEYCTIEKVADFDLFDENELNDRQNFIKLSEADTQNTVDTEEINDQPIASDNLSSTLSNDIKGPSVLESIRQNMNRISVDSDKIDYLMYLVSELITTNSQLLLMTQGNEFDTIRMQIEKLDGLCKQFRNNALEIRLIPIRDVIPKFQRMIRDVSKQLGKEVEFVTEGMETELDKSSIDIIVEPLLHLIRNALDHGLEVPEERLDKGKEAKGILKLSAWYSGNNVFVKIQDDGRGINKDKVFAKAVEKGLIEPNAKLTDKETFDLLCLSGFSTAHEVTNISGRGVGMDVVKKKIAEVRGELDIESKPEKGSSFTIKLQQSVAILDTLLVQSQTIKWLIPLADVEICTQVGRDELERAKRLGTLEHQGQMIPYISLKSYFDKNNPLPSVNNPQTKMVVLKKNDVRFAVVTDTIVGQHQAVLKNLGRMLKNHPEISAASLLGNGEVAFLLDTNQFYQHFAKAN